MTSTYQKPQELPTAERKSMPVPEIDPETSIVEDIASSTSSKGSRHNIRVGYAAHPKESSSGKYKTGEDAMCIENSDNGLFLGVFDGIGGLHSEGIDPADYSHYLADTCANFYLKDGKSHLRHLLEEAYKHHAPKGMKGATTVVLAKIANGNLDVLNLGDSGAMVFRKQADGKFKKVMRTKEQDHRFNAPFNLSTFAGETGHFADSPGDADEYRIPLQSGDVVLLMTDGITDNLYPEQLGEILNSLPQDKEDFPEKACQKIIDETDTFARSHKNTPWSDKCGRPGGKPDDQTVVLAQMQ